MLKVDGNKIEVDNRNKTISKELAYLIGKVFIEEGGMTEDELVAFIKSVCFVYGAKK